MIEFLSPLSSKKRPNLEEFLWVYMSQTDSCREAKFQQIEKNAQENGKFSPYIMQYNQKRRCEWVTWNPLVID